MYGSGAGAGRFAAALLGHRLRAHLSQEQLAECSGISVRAIGDMERGTTQRPQVATVRALADALALDAVETREFAEAARQARPPREPRSGRCRLPVPSTSTIGREDELADVTRLLTGHQPRMVTVTGPGGVGKTRVALEAGRRAAPRFETTDFVDLAAVTEPGQVAAALAAGVSLPRGLSRTLDSVADIIGDCAWLLVIDNFEHVLPAAGDVALLLSRCPRLKVLVTSRTPLRLSAEHVRELGPLTVPTSAQGHVEEPGPALTGLRRLPSVALLVERAAAVRTGFEVTVANAADVAEVCRLLDGLPLALELAAAQLRLSEPAQIAAQLRGALGGPAARTDTPPPWQNPAVDVPDRHRSLEATVEWSARRLGAEEVRLLEMLGAFVGGANPQHLAEVAAEAGFSAAVEPAAAALAGANLVSVRTDRHGRPRLVLLEAVRQVAAARLDRSSRAAAVAVAHCRVFLDLLRNREPSDDELEAEFENIRAAALTAVASRPAELDPVTVRALTRYLLGRGRFHDARDTLPLLAAATPVQAAAAVAWHGTGVAANEDRDYATALALALRAAPVFASVGDVVGLCDSRILAGAAHRELGDLVAAWEAYSDALQAAEAAGAEGRASVARNNLGTLAQDRGDADTARTLYLESLAAKRRLGDVPGQTVALANLAALALDQAQFGDASAGLVEAMGLQPNSTNPRGTGYMLALLSEARLRLGDTVRATSAAEEALALAREAGNRPVIGMALARLADLAAEQRDLTAAETLYLQALENVSGVAERARTLERLAVVLASSRPGAAARLRQEATAARAEAGVPAPPAQRMWLRTAPPGTAPVAGSGPNVPVTASRPPRGRP
ncbi:MAG: XRE family transcriptional regulator [Actinobacteria bacterium]|nr:XRE family transcriptional regulator [Actinomycetota bacterium]